MTPSSLVIVTDRGELSIPVNETPTGPSLQLVQAFNITDAHGKLVDKLSDVPGAFRNGRAGTHHGGASIAERTQLARWTAHSQELADQITKIVSLNGKDGWSFAAGRNSRSDRRSSACGGATDRRTCEIGFGQNGIGQTHFAISFVAANVNQMHQNILFLHREERISIHLIMQLPVKSPIGSGKI
jgi:hypothetical protein